MGGSTNEPMGPPVAFGLYCPFIQPGQPAAVCDEGNGACVDLGGYPLCTHSCEEQADCPFGYRCTDTGQGRACVPRCKTGKDCPGMDRATCAAAGSEGDRVCWFGVESIGEITLDKKPLATNIGWPKCIDCGRDVATSDGWRFLPGSKVFMTLKLVNAGSGRMVGELKLESLSKYLKVDWTQTASINPTTYGLLPRDYPGSLKNGTELGVTNTITAEVSPDAPLDQPLPFRITMNEYTGESFMIDFKPRPLPPTPTLAFAAPAIAADVGSATLFVANVGDGPVSGLVATSLGVTGASSSTVNPELGSGTATLAAGIDTPTFMQLGTTNVDFNTVPTSNVTAQLHDAEGHMWTLNGTLNKPPAP